MKFDRSKFFAGYRQEFKSLDQTQVEGLERLLWGVETYYGWWDNIDQIANAFCQIKHETAHSFHPCVEGYYLGDSKAPNYYTGNTDRVRRFQASLRYFPHIGRGDIQLTWEENYRDQNGYVRKYFPEIVAEFEARTLQRFDLVAHPEQALDGKISFCIVTIGMHKGTFRPGHTLDRYINANHVDHFNARDIVNGDKHYKQKPSGTKIGDVIVRDARRFAQILRTSLIDATENDIVETPGISLPTEQAAELPAVIQPGTQAMGLPQNAADPSTNEAPPPSADPVEVKKEDTSLFVKLGAAVTAITGFGINVGSLIQTKLEAMTVQQIVYMIAALGLIGGAIWWYRKAAKGAQVRTMQLVEKAADPNAATVRLVK